MRGVMTHSNASSSAQAGARRLQGLPPVAAADPAPLLLILGSMPSEASLAAGAYYAHPRNRFWPLMAALLGRREAPAAFAERAAMLEGARIALWDAIGSCVRAGSLDSAIEALEPNDIAGFLAARPSIRTVCLNGGKCAEVWRRWCAPAIPAERLAVLSVRALPSTSPANARWRFEALLAAWGEALSPVLALTPPPAGSPGSPQGA